MERVILATLRWDTAAVTPQDFLPHFLACVEEREDGDRSDSEREPLSTLRRHSDTLAAMCACDSRFLGAPPSLVAAASLNCALRGLGSKSSTQLAVMGEALAELCQTDLVSKLWVWSWRFDQVSGFSLFAVDEICTKKLFKATRLRILVFWGTCWFYIHTKHRRSLASITKIIDFLFFLHPRQCCSATVRWSNMASDSSWGVGSSRAPWRRTRRWRMKDPAHPLTWERLISEHGIHSCIEHVNQSKLLKYISQTDINWLWPQNALTCFYTFEIILLSDC